MKNTQSIKAITLGGILAAIYAIITILSVYSVVPVLCVFSLLIMPIFSAYYASIFSFKETLIFNISTLIVCFFTGIVDPMYCVLYVFPPLITGDLFGLFNKMKLKYYTTIFLQTIAFSVTNVLCLYLAEAYYEINIISTIINDKWVYDNLSLIILFVLSGAEAIFSSMFIFEKLKSFNIRKIKETSMPFYGYISIIALTVLSIGAYFVSNNVYLLLIFMILVISVYIINDFIKNVKHFNVYLAIYFVITITINFYLCFKSLFYLIPLVVISPVVVYSLVKISVYIYNIKRK